MPKERVLGCIPHELVNAVRKVVEESGSLYTSISDLVKEAVREKLHKLTRHFTIMAHRTNSEQHGTQPYRPIKPPQTASSETRFISFASASKEK